jgi:hypothetical protein
VTEVARQARAYGMLRCLANTCDGTLRRVAMKHMEPDLLSRLVTIKLLTPCRKICHSVLACTRYCEHLRADTSFCPRNTAVK